MATLQIRIDDTLKEQAAGIPFSVQHKPIPYALQEAVYDSRFRKNLYGPFDNAEDAIATMLED